MYLKLALAGEVIASAELDAKEAGNLEYLHTRRHLLTETCSALIATHRENPVYYIEVPSKMNLPAQRKNGRRSRAAGKV